MLPVLQGLVSLNTLHIICDKDQWLLASDMLRQLDVTCRLVFDCEGLTNEHLGITASRCFSRIKELRLLAAIKAKEIQMFLNAVSILNQDSLAVDLSRLRQ